jgi:alpha-glucosidase (family GH31 glycosyl hydrolase)
MELSRVRTLSVATVPLLVAGAVAAVTLAPVGAASTLKAAPPGSGALADPSTLAHFHGNASTLTLAVPAAAGAPGYTVVVRTAPFQITTQRSGGTVLQTTAGIAGSSGPADFQTATGWATGTSVQTSSWHDGVLDLTLATTVSGDTVAYRITPQTDRYRMTWSVQGRAAATQVASHYITASAGHWYGQGEAQTPDGGPYTQQPWPLDSGTVRDSTMGPAEYLMTDPFWFTQRGTGLWVNTNDVMDVAMNAIQPGVFGYALTGSQSMDTTVFVERAAHDVYNDYIGITGTPAKSDATAAQYAKPLFNTWAQFYTDVTQASTLSWATGLHQAGVPAHTIQVDDGWATHYGDTTFNSKFPDPKKLSDQIHALGYDFGLWDTLWINNDATNYAYAAQQGYLLKSKADPTKACSVTWWNGVAGIVDLGNPAARAWYVGQLQDLEKTYGVNGFKFDTRFFDESCAPSPGYTALDYLTLGAQMADQFDQQGAGVRISWTGSQKYGFVTRQVDKGTGWNSLQAAVSQTLAITTIGYPFVETDMIGGSMGQTPPTKQVLVRWAQAASLMPLMYSSTSPLGVSTWAGTQAYDQQTVDLYAAAVKTHGLIAPYIDEQVSRAVKTGEPIMKPLFFNYPADQSTYAINDEWLLGDSLLAAPILSDGTSRNIHVPSGRWYDVAHARVVTGPVDLSGYTAALAQTPTFVRLGTPDSAMLMRALAPTQDRSAR